MQAFDYLSVMVSIVLGLGVTQLLTSLAAIIRERDAVKPYWLTVLWIWILIHVHVLTWWTMFGLRDHQDWSFPAFFILLLQPIVLYLLSALLSPHLGREPDSVAAFERHSRVFFALFIILLLISLGKDLIISGVLPETRNLVAHAAFLGLSVAAVLTKRRVHEILGPISAVLVVAYIATLFMRLN